MMRHIGWALRRQLNPRFGRFCIAALFAMAWAGDTMAQSAEIRSSSSQFLSRQTSGRSRL